MSQLPQDVIDHCNAHPMCKGCPLRTCVAPLSDAGRPEWANWIQGRIEAVRAIKEGS